MLLTHIAQVNSSTPKFSALPLPIGYLIVTHPDFAAGIQPLADWKAHIGYDVTVVTTTVTGSSATQIRSYIQNAYNSWSVPPQFVLLVGDSGYVPGFQGSTTGSIDDLDYSLMDGGNYFPDLFVGRFSVANTTQLQRVLEGFGQLQQRIESEAYRRAGSLAEAHQRVRESARQAGKVTVEPQLPADILGVYIFLPAGGGS